MATPHARRESRCVLDTYTREETEQEHVYRSKMSCTYNAREVLQALGTRSRRFHAIFSAFPGPQS
jgi:hypothetical protein